MARQRYDASDETLYKPVSTSELDALLTARGRPVLDKYRIQHFLWRVRLTLHTAEETNREARRAVEAASEKKRRAGTPTTLTPIDAVKFASPEELSVIVGNISSAQLNALQGHVNVARDLRRQLLADLATVRAAVETISRRDDIDATIRADFLDLLALLPDEPAEVPIPKALELGHMAGLITEHPAHPGTPAGPAALEAPAHASESGAPRQPVAALPAPASPQLAPTAPMSPPMSPVMSPAAVPDGFRELTSVAALAQYLPPPSWQPGPGLVRQPKELT